MKISLKIPGFNFPNIDAFIKIGGSLFSNFEKLSKLIETLVLLPSDYRIVLFPGGGPLDRLVEDIHARIHLSPEIPHHACALAQDQSGLILSNFSKRLVPIADFEHLHNILNTGQVPILLPSKLILSLGIFEKSFDITSDSIGGFFAAFLEARKYLVLKSIDGITNKFVKSNLDYKANIHSDIIVNLANVHNVIWGDEIDVVLPQLILESGLKCWVINGNHPERIIDVLEGRPTIATQISAE